MNCFACLTFFPLPGGCGWDCLALGAGCGRGGGASSSLLPLLEPSSGGPESDSSSRDPTDMDIVTRGGREKGMAGWGWMKVS